MTDNTNQTNHAQYLKDRIQVESEALAWLGAGDGNQDDDQDAILSACNVLDDYQIAYDVSRDDWREHSADQLRDALRDSPLSIDRKIVLDVTYCTGGPAYGLIMEFVNDGDSLTLDAARTWGQDWFTARNYCEIEENSATWEYLRAEYEELVESMEKAKI